MKGNWGNFMLKEYYELCNYYRRHLMLWNIFTEKIKLHRAYIHDAYSVKYVYCVYTYIHKQTAWKINTNILTILVYGVKVQVISILLQAFLCEYGEYFGGIYIHIHISIYFIYSLKFMLWSLPLYIHIFTYLYII